MTWPTTRFPTSTEIADRLRELAADSRFTSICTVTNLPNTTQGGKTPNFVRVGKPGTLPTVLITGGVHAREWAPPTAIVNLVQALLEAYVGNLPITTGTLVRSAEDVKAIIEGVALFVAPMVNPDGYDFSLGADGAVVARKTRGWRKNRRPAPATLPAGCTAANAIGVDVNRNFDVLWDFDNFYVDPQAVQCSKNPCDEIFIGPAAFSEPESRNVKFLLDTHEPQFFVDVHMFGEDILHSWGVEENDPVSTPTPVLNPGRVRDGTTVSGAPFFNGYKEPINEDFLDQVIALANLMADATQGASGTRYAPQPGSQLISISGAADDFSFSRNLGTAKAPIKAYTIECGQTFLPRFATEFPTIQNEVQAALLALLRHAARPPSTSCHCG